MLETREKFAKDFVINLYGKISNDDLRIVLQELQIFVDDYDISLRETAVIPYQPGMLKYYQSFVVSKKIEGISDNTLKTYHYYLKDYFEQVTKPLNEITTNDIRIYLYSLQERKKISNRSLDGRRIVINSFMHWCTQEGYISYNPCGKIGRIKYEEKRREPLTDVEFELVRNSCKTQREKAMVEILYSTGCRVTELIRLNISDVNFQTKEVLLYGKGNKHRISYMNAKAEVAVKTYLSNRDDTNEALFITERKPYKRLSKESVEAIVKAIGKRANINRNVYPHLIRHTIASDLINRGMDVTALQKMLGHEKLDTTMIYAKVNQETVKHNHKRFVN